MNANILRQLKDIQYQADKISTGKTTSSEIEDFSKYSNELKDYLLKNVKEPEVLKFIDQIPMIPTNSINLKKGMLALIIPAVLLSWYYEKSYIDKTKNLVTESSGKYASIEFLLKNYFS